MADEWSSEVVPGLHIGSILSAQNKANLIKYGITAILSVGCEIEVLPADKIDYFSLDYIKDSPEQAILHEWEKTIKFIHDNLTKTGNNQVLVHCVYGQSRSAATIAAYLIHVLKYEFELAMKVLKIARPILCINPGFLCQLHYLSFHGLSNAVIDLITNRQSTYTINKNELTVPSSVAIAPIYNGKINEPLTLYQEIDYGIFCGTCRQLLALEKDEIANKHFLDYTSMLDLHTDEFWKGYVSNHSQSNSHNLTHNTSGKSKSMNKDKRKNKSENQSKCNGFTECPSSHLTLISGFPLYAVSSNTIKYKRKITDVAVNIGNNSHSNTKVSHLVCPCCDSVVGHYNERSLLLFRRYLAVDLFALDNNCIVRLPVITATAVAVTKHSMLVTATL